MPERTPKQILTNRMHGFSTAWRKGSDPEAYARNYERIFRKAEPIEPEPEFEQPPPGFTEAVSGLPEVDWSEDTRKEDSGQ